MNIKISLLIILAVIGVKAEITKNLLKIRNQANRRQIKLQNETQKIIADFDQKIKTALAPNNTELTFLHEYRGLIDPLLDCINRNSPIEEKNIADKCLDKILRNRLCQLEKNPSCQEKKEAVLKAAEDIRNTIHQS